jgi:predicted MFS family arabinose efflux permease
VSIHLLTILEIWLVSFKNQELLCHREHMGAPPGVRVAYLFSFLCCLAVFPVLSILRKVLRYQRGYHKCSLVLVMLVRGNTLLTCMRVHIIYINKYNCLRYTKHVQSEKGVRCYQDVTAFEMRTSNIHYMYASY